jgi:RNA-dependent RNA polymerase
VSGTPVAKCSQPRKRRDLMARMRDLTDQLVRSVRDELAGDDESLYGALERAWLAWNLSLRKGDAFGAVSFGWVALGGILEAIKGIEEAVRAR